MMIVYKYWKYHDADGELPKRKRRKLYFTEIKLFGIVLFRYRVIDHSRHIDREEFVQQLQTNPFLDL